MDEVEQRAPQNPTLADYMPSAGIVGAIFSVITFAIGLAIGYQQIGSEPSGSFLSPTMLGGVVICLVSCLAGALAVWHFTKEVTPFIKLGQGAALGFITGAVMVILTAILGEIWNFIDPSYTENLVEATIANVEAMDLPDSQKDQMIDGMAESVRSQQSFGSQIIWGIPMNGLLNLVTAMIGVKIFAKKENQESF
ncbi:DUF4199 domain-containing protein [Rhodohalobacter sp. SW132]|uniref:DUF4199 domain-containing protein n=1 Tax=Rhodohalobacter sp. SW132 TaxID=2293433 RepID=UPI000E22BB1C|nr:DUF4199 domain-containing protein [Rhodohalobacter sp. SW132]REL24569.1 DUF4199 domain-containing protein [Rhodohalobacter sp. SW132]